jgi:hypothetical protein
LSFIILNEPFTIKLKGLGVKKVCPFDKVASALMPKSTLTRNEAFASGWNGQ